MNRRYIGVVHECEDTNGRMQERVYPEFHWVGEGLEEVADRSDPDHRKVLVCDACGSKYRLPVEVAA